jgi:hypothetical protein
MLVGLGGPRRRAWSWLAREEVRVEESADLLILYY